MKTLFYDVETMGERGWYWPPRYDTNIIHVDHFEHLMSVAWSWDEEKKIQTAGLDDFSYYKQGRHNDKELVKLIRGLFNEATVVVAHNGNNFDQRMVNARIMTHHLPPPSPYRQIDTKNVAKKNARFASNKLDDLGGQLELGQKLSHGNFKELWLAADNGDKSAWRVMKRYNRQDVKLLKQLYLELRPWITNHPSMNLMSGKLDACPNCGRGPLSKNGSYYTKVSRFQVWHCNNCLANPRSRLADKTEKIQFIS